MIHLKTFNRKQLDSFVSSGEFQKYDFLPITEHRAKSQIANPKADHDQILLILAFYDDQLAGYIGCLPDDFKLDDETFRYAWLSTLFISSRFRGKKIAQALLNRAFDEYNGNIAITEFTKEAESLYNKIGVFKYIKPKEGKKYYFRTDLETIIPSRKERTKFLKPIFRIADSVANFFISIKNSFIKHPDFPVEILDHPDQESAAFVSDFKNHRIADEINWAIENPWILEGETRDERYLFSSYSKNFRYFWLKIYCENKNLITCSLLILRDGHLKIPYLFSIEDLTQFINFMNYFIIENNVKTMTCYQTELNQKIETSLSFPSIYERKIERRYMFHENLIHHLPQNFNPDFQDGDGDCLMT